MEYQDKEVQCCEKGCPNTFFLSAKTQQGLIEKGWALPKRCIPHRETKKAFFAAQEAKRALKDTERQKGEEEQRRREGSPFNPKNWKSANGRIGVQNVPQS